MWALSIVAVGCGCGGPSVAPPRKAESPELVGRWYTVQAGDSVTILAQRHDVLVDDIIELNGIVDPDRIRVGQTLFLYGVDEIVRRSGGSSAAPGVERSVVVTPRYIWPVRRGALSSGFGQRGARMHRGIDIAADAGTPVRAVADGEVIYSDNKQRGYGNLVILRHPGNAVTVYAHNRRNLVDEGQTVRQGALIAEVGSTGRSTGSHLHFEIRLGGEAKDPMEHLPKR